MKKTILLASLVAVASMANGTTGTVKGFFESEGKFETNKVVSTDKKKIENKTDKSYKVGKIGVETEVKVKNTGLSFGGTFQAKDLALGNVYRSNYLNNSSVFVKYELPEIKGINSYVKATINPKFIQEFEANKSVDKGNAQLEADVNYAIMKDVKLGLNTKTTLPFSNEKFGATKDSKKTTEDYSTKVSSTHKLYVDAKEVSVLKDVKAEISVNHTYKESAKDAKDAFKYVQGKVEATYDKVKDVKLEGKVSFKRNVAEGKVGDYEILGHKLYKEAPARYIHSYEMKGTYTGVKDLTLTAKPFVAHINVGKTETNNKLKREDVVLYGAELSAEYKMLNNALTLTGKSLLAGVHDSQIDESKATDAEKYVKHNTGVFIFNANAKYDYKVTDKFTVSPEANAKLDLTVTKVKVVDKETLVTEPELTLTPKVSAEYKPAESLTIKGEVSVPVNFSMIDKFKKETSGDYSNDGHKFGYKSTSIKTALNVEYKW